MQNHTNWIISFEKRIIFCENSKWFYGYIMTTQILVQGKNVNKLPSSQLIFACSKSAIETLEKGVKYVQSDQ